MGTDRSGAGRHAPSGPYRAGPGSMGVLDPVFRPGREAPSAEPGTAPRNLEHRRGSAPRETRKQSFLRNGFGLATKKIRVYELARQLGVDNAVVVVESIYHYREKYHDKPWYCAVQGT